MRNDYMDDELASMHGASNREYHEGPREMSDSAKVAALRKALEDAIEALEDYAETIDGEWGFNRDIAQIEKDGNLPPCIAEAREALGATK